jgi:serine/threonine-protein kinase
MSLVGRVFSNRYEISREVAQGGMAEVYLGHDRLLDRPVAVKALFPEYAREPSFVERFRREAQAAANLNNANIVGIYDWGQEAGTYFIVMEYVEGRSLRDLVRSEAPLNANQSAEITAEIASALAFAHRSGVVHRDVKPGNVLLTRAGGVKVTDFGIARAGTSDGLTQTGSVMGTATYFSPEQAQGLAVDGRSDVYSLGVVLYEMVTGVVPFTGDSPVAVAYKHVREEPMPPTKRNPDVPADLEQIILTALAKDPDLRYQTADDMRADLLRFRRGRPLSAAPVTALVADATGAAAAATMASPRVGAPPTPERDVTRRRALVTALTVLVLVVIVALILGFSLLADDGSGGGTVLVPDVVGLNIADATEELEEAGLVVDSERVANDEIAADVVISQDPPGAQRIDEGDTVTLQVSSGVGEVDIPDLSGQLTADAITLLGQLGFETETEAESSDDIEAGRVIRTDPAVGESAPRGSIVVIVESSGREQVPVPDVVGLQSEEGQAALTAAGFLPDEASESSDTVESGRVIRTEPPAPQPAPRGSRVRMIVSSGTRTVAVPEVRGQPLDAARNTLRDADLTSTVIEQDSTPGNAGLVLAQSVEPGTRVAPGSSIVLTVGVSSASTTTAPPTTPTS